MPHLAPRRIAPRRTTTLHPRALAIAAASALLLALDARSAGAEPTPAEIALARRLFAEGRAAEELIYGHHSTGASDDLAKVTDIARNMVTRYGMAPAELGPVTYESEPSSFLGQPMGTRRLYAEATARDIDVAVRTLVEAQFGRARKVLSDNRPLLERSAQTLLASETLAGAELEAILAEVLPKRAVPEASAAV